MHAQTPTFKSTSSYRIANPNYSAQQLDPTTIGNQAYRSTIYTPFGSSTPSSNNNPGGNNDSGSGTDDDDVGIPGWADTPSEPLPIGDTAPLFLFAAAMIAIIWIRQRRKLQTQSINTSNNNDNSDSMHTTRHISSNRLQKFFLLLAFVCFVGQVSGQTYYKREIYNKSQANGNSPANFPYSNESGTNGIYKGAYQSAYINNTFYVYDKFTPGLVKITTSNGASLVSNSNYHNNSYKDRPGTCRDDAGNLIINPCYSNLYVFAGGNLNNKTIVTYSHSDLESACNYINASGDVINGTGYVYFFPNGKTKVYIVKITKGKIDGSIITKKDMRVTGASASYVIPIDNNPNKFIYQTRNNNYYLYDNGNHTELTNTSSNTVGGIVFTLGGEQMFIRTAHDTYKGGWNMRKMSAIGTNVLTQEALGSSGLDRNQSVGAFFNYERVNDYTVKLYEYCQGHGIAAWKIGTSVSKKFRIQTYDGESWVQNANGGTILVEYNDGAREEIKGASDVPLGLDEACTVNLTATNKSGYEFVGWYINETSGIGSQFSPTTTYIPTRSNFGYVTARFAQMKNQTVNIHTYDATQNKYVANVAGGSVSVRYNNLGRGETTATLSSTSGTYTSLINSTVTLTATPENGYVFVGWYKGDEHLDWAKTNKCSFKADNAYNITARFTKLVTQTFKVQTYESTAYADGGNGGTMTVNYNDGTTETVTNSTSISNLYQGYNVTLTANAKTGYKFMGWFNNDFTTEYSKGSNTYTYRGEGTRTIHARFRKTYNQTVNISTYNPATGQYVSGGDGGIVTSVTYDDGNAQSLSDVTNSTFTPLVNTTVTVVANAKPGYQFDGWYSGETLLSKDIEYTYTVTAAKTITARFIKNDVQLVVSVMNYNTDYAEFVEYPHDNNTVTIATGGNSTTVTSSTSQIINYGSTVTLTASHDDHETEGYDFIGWYQNNKRISSDKTYTFTLTDHSAISAHFAPKQCHKVILYHTFGGQYQVKYARQELFDVEGSYYVANSLFNKDTTIFVPYEAKLAVIESTTKPTIGYKYTGYRVSPADGGKQNDGTYIINPGMTNGVKNVPQVFVGFVRTEEQVVYLDLSSHNLSEKWKDGENPISVDKIFISLRNVYHQPESSILDKVNTNKIKLSETLCAFTIPADLYTEVAFYYIKDREQISTTPFVIPATRFNCMKLNGAWNSVANGYVDAWTTLDTENGDYRLIYREQTVVDKNNIRVDYEFNEGDRIKKITSGTKTDIVSLHIYNKVSNDGVNGINNPEVILQQWSDNKDAWVDVERYMVFGPLRSNDASVIKMPNRKNTANEVVRVDLGINNIMTDKTDNGCGVWNFVIEQDGTTARLLVDQTHRYESDYFIRTSNADGQWYNYTIPASKMTYSEYAKKNSDFSHYFCRYIDIDETGTAPQGAGSHKNVKFTVANRYAAFLCSELLINNTRFTDDEYEDDIFVNQEWNGKTYEPSLPVDATVRFGWDIVTNRLTRAYIADTEFKNNEYLIVEGDKIGDVSGEKAYFDEIGDHFYQIDLSAQVPSDIKVKAKMNGNYQFFMGSENATAQLIGGKADGSYPVRLLYDFKNDRFITICELAGTINGNINLETSVMIVREHNEAPKQLTFANNDASITAKPNVPNTGQDQYTKPAYAVMTFLEDKLMDNNVSKYEKMFYWISFPFDVKISDVFGLGEYGKYWIMEEYDGKQRAQNGLAQTNWKYITKKSHVLEQNVGYVLCLNYNQILQDQLFTSHGAGEFGHSKLSLYFPSNSVISPAMLKGGQTVTRTLERMENNATAWNHHNWHLIGVPSFATPGFKSEQDNIPFLYQYWHPGDAYAAVTPKDVTFHAMHSFMVQYYGDITWTSVVNTGTPLSIAAKKDTDADKKIMLRLELQQAGSTIDKTYVQLRNDKGTKGFDMSLDLTKIINAGANIYSIVDNHEMAGNAIPKDETVLPLGVVITAAGEYTFAMPNGTEGIMVELIDYEQGTCTNLLVGDYTVNMPEGTNNTRFALRLKPDKVATSVEDITSGTNDNNVRKLLIDGVLYLQQGNTTYDAQGHAIR